MKAGSGKLALALTVGCLVCLAVPGAALAGTLDQQQTNVTTKKFIGGAPSPSSVAQTFTAGLSGGLDQVDLNLATSTAPNADLNVEIRDVSGGQPGSTVLASHVVPLASVPADPNNAFVPVNFASPARVVAGTQYAIVAWSSTASSMGVYEWWGTLPESAYAAGAPFVSLTSPPSGPWSDGGIALAFKTYVATSTPPGPTGTTGTATGERAAAKKRCKKKFPKGARRTKCLKKAKKLPV
jgi:hypothetical protein